MITEKEAQNYAEQLHPAFAGYLHDGEITERDALATIFHLINEGVLEPEFIDNNILRGIAAVRMMNKKPKYPFEKIIIDRLFQSNFRITAPEIGDFIKRKRIQRIIEVDMQSIGKYDTWGHDVSYQIGKNLGFKLFHNSTGIASPLDDLPGTITEAKNKRKLLYLLLFPYLMLIGIGLLITGIFWPHAEWNKSRLNITPGLIDIHQEIINNQLDMKRDVISGGIALIVFSLLLLILTKGKVKKEYYLSNKSLPETKEKYHELYNFLKTHPLREHTFTNPYLPFCITFGLDNSWQKDFGLDNELQVTSSPMINDISNQS